VTTRTLVLLRHAKSDRPTGIDDSDRPLAERGRRDALVAGALLADLIGSCDAVRVSSAVRTQQTWELIADLVDARDVATEPAIYEATPTTLLAVVRALPESATCALLVGHNPGVAELAMMLSDSGDRDARQLLAERFPTSGVAILEITGEWADLTPEMSSLIAMHVPRAASH
jgi:phosphohistidine phosphatase